MCENINFRPIKQDNRGMNLAFYFFGDYLQIGSTNLLSSRLTVYFALPGLPLQISSLLLSISVAFSRSEQGIFAIRVFLRIRKMGKVVKKIRFQFFWTGIL